MHVQAFSTFDAAANHIPADLHNSTQISARVLLQLGRLSFVISYVHCFLITKVAACCFARTEICYGYDCYVSLGSFCPVVWRFLTGLQSTSAASHYMSSEITSWGWHHGLRIYALGRCKVQVNFQKSWCYQRTRRIGGPLVPNRMWASRK